MQDQEETTDSDATPRASTLDVLRSIESELKTGGRVVELHGTAGALGPAIAAHFARGSTPAPLVYVVADEDQAEARAADATFFLPERRGHDDPLSPPPVLHLPAFETSPYAEVQPDRGTIMRRMAALFRLTCGFPPDILVASAAALFRRVVPRDPFVRLCRVVRRGDSIDRDALAAGLVAAGYGNSTVVEDPGTFAVRGAVVDVFPPVYRHPIRLELFGDEIDSIRLYDAATQRTLRPLEEIHIHPVRETLASEGADPRAKILHAADAAVFPSSRTRLLLEQVEAGEQFFGIEALAPAFHARMAPLFEYLPQGAWLVVEDPAAVVEQARRHHSHLRDIATARVAEHRLALDASEYVLSEEEAAAALAGCTRLELPAVEVERAAAGGPPRFRLHAESNATLRAELQRARGREGDDDPGRPLRDRVRAWLDAGQRVLIAAPNRTHAERLHALLAALDLKADLAPHAGGDFRSLLDSGRGGPRLALRFGPLARGFRLPDDRLVLVAEEEIFGRRAHIEVRPPSAPPFGDLGEIQAGDAVVHQEHGIGRYRGLTKLEVNGVHQDFVHLQYEGGTVYLPVYRIGMLHRYVGGDAEGVRLDRLGGKTWQDKRRRVSAEARKLAEEMLQLYAQRKALAGHAFPAPDAMFREFEETFPFEETADQAAAIEAVVADMQSESPMDRLICGDVGYGKTEVALRAALLAVLGRKQVAVLAPTTVLAEQHYLTFSERLAEFPVRLAALSRFRSKAELQRTVADVSEGKIDIVIGTHRLLSRDVRFADLGLVVIDEEQHFGVAHKERLKELRTQVDVITMTATPIPRTLQMSMSGLRDLSLITTAPASRLAIRTFVSRWDPELLGEAIRRELQRGGQLFFVHNRVEDIGEWAEKVRDLAPAGTRVAVAHGQMAEGALEKVMVDFVDGRHDVLVCTTIIESGLDIPRANTMIVNRADRFGLAQLYQLRGRIGRGKERAFCYLVVPQEGTMTPEAKLRLAVLQRFTDLGAGFQIASHDLEIRGAGELLGDRQSGMVAAVGFETYARLLEEAVAELRGQPIRPEIDPEVTVDVPAFLPDDYVPDMGQRLELYRRLAEARDEDEVGALLSELEDRYGRLPDEARLLGEVMIDKTLVRRLGALAYELGPARMQVSLGGDTRLDPGRVLRMIEDGRSRWRLHPDMRITYAFSDDEKRDRMAAARRRLHDIAACMA